MKTVIIDYGSGNLHSAAKAIERAANDAEISNKTIVSSDAQIVHQADRIILPGVGAFADCKAGLMAVAGMTEALEEKVRKQGTPFLGICVGTQLMAERGLEKGVTSGLGWIGGEVCQITPNDPSLKIPQIGWNTLTTRQPHPILEGIQTGKNGWHAYFVHSYHIETTHSDELIATTDYGGEVTAIVGKDNWVGTQFHPEKSQALGLALLTNFLKWKP